MTLSMEEFNALKSKVESLQRKADKAEGALEQTMAILKEEYSCDSIEEAAELAEKFREEADTLEARFEKAESTFDDKWGKVLS